jgi:hypothetical protein
MRIFTTIALCFVWLSSFSQEKTIVVKKDITPEFTLNGKFKNNDIISKSVLDSLIIVVNNCDCEIISYDIIYPISNSQVTVVKQLNHIIDSDVLKKLKAIKPGQIIIFQSIIVKDKKNNEIKLPTTVYRITD